VSACNNLSVCTLRQLVVNGASVCQLNTHPAMPWLLYWLMLSAIQSDPCRNYMALCRAHLSVAVHTVYGRVITNDCVVIHNIICHLLPHSPHSPRQRLSVIQLINVIFRNLEEPVNYVSADLTVKQSLCSNLCRT